MIRSVQRPWFEVWGSEEAQNRILKGFLVLMTALSVAEAIALTIISTRPPVLISLSETQSQVVKSIQPSPELLAAEFQRVISQFIQMRHNWEPATIEQQIQSAAKWVAPDSQSKFLSTNAQQIKIAKEKHLSQRFYIHRSSFDLINRRAKIIGDRILIIDGLRAATQMEFDLVFDYGTRTTENPEGIYITSEDLIPEPPAK